MQLRAGGGGTGGSGSGEEEVGGGGGVAFAGFGVTATAMGCFGDCAGEGEGLEAAAATLSAGFGLEAPE